MSDPKDIEALEKLLSKMLSEDRKITARSVAREEESPFKHASDLTRQPARRAILGHFQAKQRELRLLMEKSDPCSRTNLQAQVSRLTQENATLKAERDLLIASHKAMLLAVGELGGIKAWQRMFPAWEATQGELRKVGALPSAKVLPLEH